MGSLLLALLAAASPSSARWATAVSSLIKVRPGTSLPLVESVSLHAARGECEAFQVATTVPARALRLSALEWRPPAPPSVSVNVYREAFVAVTTPSGPDGATGLWPDPLIPQRDAYAHEPRDAFGVSATDERPAVYYVELCAGRDARPGEYLGQLTLRAANRRPAAFSVRLRVDPFELPATSSLPNSFGLSLYSVAKGHHLDPASPEAHALLRRYAVALLSDRITAYGLTFEPPPTTIVEGRVQLDFTTYDRELGPFFEGKVSLPGALGEGARFTSAGLIPNPRLTTDAARIAYERAWRDHFLQRRWPVALFYYAKDEPSERDFPKVIAEGKRLHQAGGVSVLVTSAFEPPLSAATDVYCPVLNCFFPAAGAATCKHPLTVQALRRRIPAWAHIWWYQSCLSHGCNGPVAGRQREAFRGWPSYMVDLPVPRNRAMGPLAYLQGIGGELYFDTVFAFNQQDPWTSVYAFGGNGDGTLFYPGIPERIGGRTPIPVESLRLKAIRDGLEDYEYLRLARSLGLSALADASARQLAPSGNQISDDPAVWTRVRDELARQIAASWGRTHPVPPAVPR